MDGDSTQIVLPGPQLPPDLERLIFELVALSHPTSIPTLMLVAWRIKSWLEPSLYRVLCVTTQKGRDSFPAIPVEVLLRALEARPPTPLMAGVEHLFFHRTPSRYSPSATLNALLTACPRITTLSSLVGYGVSPDALGSLRNLRRLAINVRDLFSPDAVDFAHPLFRNITHLELFDVLGQEESEAAYSSYATMATLPNLSHVAFNGPWLCRAMELLFQAHRGERLSCFVFLSSRETPWGPHLPQFVHIHQTDFLGDWLGGVDKGEDQWALAERFIAKKRAGTVADSLYEIWDRHPLWRA
ncbi:hypothetical protein C8R46DRAFT_183995 [Mycena filopes]|nr:hypothetical protein C8R46DRAFT_183995 [Mycena filopes]